ncbi:MAG: hypothetical protein KTR24_02430 [Saprospiraceae bacterium]|nr:hypothetical protein [Saprospiraceae bacterium]
MLNAFAFFDLPQSMEVDLADLKKRFYAKSRALHPDFHTLADADTQSRMVEQSAFNNRAYRTLSDHWTRLEHLLLLNDVLQPEGSNALPQDFLMEMMELNEAVMEAQMDPTETGKEQIINQLKQIREELTSGAAHVLTLPDLTDISTEDWTLLLELHLKNNYLTRLENNMLAPKIQ